MTDQKPLLSTVSQLQELMPDGVISTEPDVLDAVANSDPLLQAGKPPTCILSPANAGELQAVIYYANQASLNLTVTSSTGVHRHGAITNPGENILIDLSHWRKVDLIDRRNRVCRIEPGVTYGQLIVELGEHNMTLPLPLAPRRGKSVLASIMDREPTTWPNKQWDSSDPVGSTEFFFGTGDRFRSGAAGGPGTIEQQRESGGAQKFSSGPSQTDFHRVIQGAQGTMGILTWITLRTELLPSHQETLVVGSRNLENLLPFVYDVQRGRLGEHAFILNRVAVEMLLAGENQDASSDLKEACPEYVLLQNIAGFERLPQERLEYHEKEIRGFARKHGLLTAERVGGIQASELLARATHPCGDRDWRDQLFGASLSVFFLSTLDRMPSFQSIFVKAAKDHGIPNQQIAIYLQPVVQNHACHVEFILPVDPGSEAEIGRMRSFESHVVSELIRGGAYFSRPYGSAAELVWGENQANYDLLKNVKKIFDPNRVLQRGKWGL